jgi:hypothetical protein
MSANGGRYAWSMDGQQDSEPLGSFGEREARIAYNECWFRDLNRRKAEWMSSGLTASGFRCECGSEDCGVRLPLSKREWDEVRAEPNRFAVAPGHVTYEVEKVVKEYPNFWLVEKQGEAEDIAKALD